MPVGQTALTLTAGLQLTKAAVNWPAWCDRPLLVEFDYGYTRGALPIQLAYVPHMEIGRFVKEWSPESSEFYATYSWIPEERDGEVVLIPLYQAYEKDKKTGIIRDDRLRLRGCSGAGTAPRMKVSQLPALAPFAQDQTWVAAMAEMKGRTVSLNVRLNGAVHSLKTLPFQLVDVVCEGGIITLTGPSGIYLQVQADLQRIRYEPHIDHYWLLDLFHDGVGYTPSLQIHGAPAPGVVAVSAHTGRRSEAHSNDNAEGSDAGQAPVENAPSESDMHSPNTGVADRTSTAPPKSDGPQITFKL